MSTKPKGVCIDCFTFEGKRGYCYVCELKEELREAVERDTKFPMSQIEVIEDAMVSYISGCTESELDIPENWTYWAQMMIGVDRTGELVAEHFRGEEVEAERAAVERCAELERELATLRGGPKSIERALQGCLGDLERELARADKAEAATRDAELRARRTDAKRLSLMVERDVAVGKARSAEAYSQTVVRNLMERCELLDKAVSGLDALEAERDALRDDQANTDEMAQKLMEQRDAARGKTQEAIANAIDAGREQASEDGTWPLTEDPHEAYVEGMRDAYVIARDWEPTTKEGS